MIQYQTLATIARRPLAFVIIGVVGIANSVFAQSEIRSELLPTPPDPIAEVLAPVATPDGRQADSESGEDLGYEPLLQGPVHEAFASHEDSASVSPRVYPQAPPADVREQAPEDPDSESMSWIPGYWSWDDQADKYIWVSGVYRNTPPGQTWVPGSWSQFESGYRWTSGFWAGKLAATDSRNYLPMPPQSIDNGPSVPPPTDDCFWLPGSWEYDGSGYRWRSGYWTRHYENWVWQPACYINTPRGFVYNTGYWDYLPPNRGMLYAPVDFYRPVYGNPGFVYRPRFPLANSAALLLNLFARRGHSGFYYGDFYGPSYAALGYRPWYDLGYGYGGYRNGGYGNGFGTPWLAYYDWNYGRQGIDFMGSMGRYRSFYDQAGRGGPSSMQFQFDKNFAKLAGNTNPGRLPRNAAPGSFDEVVLRDFNGQSPPRAERKPQGNSSKQHGGEFKNERSKVGSNANGGSNRDFAPSSPKQSIPGFMNQGQGGKSRDFGDSPQSSDRGRSQSSFDRGSSKPRGSDSLGKPNQGGGQSFGGGNSGRGGGNAGKGSSKSDGGKGGGNGGKGGGKKK